MRGAPRVFSGNYGHLPQHSQRARRDVFEVANRRSDDVQRGGHETGEFNVPFNDLTMGVSEPLPHFVDDLLGYLHETHPTHATLDGVHTHDDLLEDVSRHAIDAEVHALAGYLRRLDE